MNQGMAPPILAVAVWLKMNRKYFNEGMAKEACERFDVKSQAVVQSADGEKVPWWYSS